MKIEFKNRPTGAVWPHVFATLLLVLAACGAAHAQTRSIDPAALATPTPEGYVDPIRLPEPAPTPNCNRIIKADVVALDQPLVFNRLGAMNPGGMIFALRNDVKAISSGSGMGAGNVQLKDYKRPRPLTLRMNVGDCIQILSRTSSPRHARKRTSPTRARPAYTSRACSWSTASSTTARTSGTNTSSLVAPGGTDHLHFLRRARGQPPALLSAATTGGEGDGGTLAHGLFGSVNVEPKGAEWYRSQLKADELGSRRRRTRQRRRR